ncbi:MAG: YfhO family protein [Thermoanaerobaculia bacterium]|nr:YfhO family protein [Thermoanaerobaculia bacterium]
MRDRLTRRLPLAAGAAALLWAVAPLLRPATLLAVRDLPVFHLPLRIGFAAAAREGLPAWNPTVHGGQPILSNPNYAAFYPPSWLALALDPVTALHLALGLHAALGFVGAWLLARRLGCDDAPAALAATGFAAGGVALGIASWVPGYTAYAWLPWVLLAADRLLAAPRPRAGAVAALAALFALQLLAGEPVAVLVSIVATACLAIDRPRAAPRALTRLALAGALALPLAAVQLLPAVGQLGESARSSGLSAADATTWSTAPVRLAEYVSPRLFGDPLSETGRRWFGWPVHDQDFPYLISIYAGIPVLVLAMAALLRGGIPRRLAWAGMTLVGLLVALGRHNPVYALLAETVPGWTVFRYPEKFLLLPGAALPFAAALGWQAVLERRRRGDRGAADFPTAVAGVVVALAALPPLLLTFRPEVGRWLVNASSPLPWTDEQTAAAVGFLLRETWVPAGVAAVTFLLLLAHRLARPREPWLAIALVALLAADLARHGRALLPTVPYPTVLAEGTVARRLAPAADRIWVDDRGSRAPAIRLVTDRPGPAALWSSVDRLEPYVGTLWGLSYALNPDTDLMLTGAARRALDLLERSRGDGEARRRLLGAWGVSHLVRPVPLEAALRSRWLTGRDPEAAVEPNPHRLPRLRFVPEVVFYPTAARAAEAALADGLRLARREHWIAPGRPAGRTRSALDTRAWAMTAGARRHSLAYRAGSATYLVVGLTYHRGWRAIVDGLETRVHATAAGQIGLELPAGEHRVELVFWDPRVTWGAALTLATLLLMAGVGLARRRRAPQAGGG